MSDELKEFSELIEEQFEIEDISIEAGNFWDTILLKVTGEL